MCLAVVSYDNVRLNPCILLGNQFNVCQFIVSISISKEECLMLCQHNKCNINTVNTDAGSICSDFFFL